MPGPNIDESDSELKFVLYYSSTQCRAGSDATLFRDASTVPQPP
jgi:hypothetical protein